MYNGPVLCNLEVWLSCNRWMQLQEPLIPFFAMYVDNLPLGRGGGEVIGRDQNINRQFSGCTALRG